MMMFLSLLVLRAVTKKAPKQIISLLEGSLMLPSSPPTKKEAMRMQL